MKKIPVESKVICENSKSMFNYFAWPSVGRLPDGNLAMVCSGYRIGHVDAFGKAVICYSGDEGKRWTRPMPFIDTAEDDRDCGILVYNGKVMLNTFNNGVEGQWIMCAGRHYNYQPRDLNEAYLKHVDAKAEDEKHFGSLYVLSDDGYHFSEIYRSPVQSPHGPCILPDGKRLFVGIPFSIDNVTDKISLEVYSIDEEENFVHLSSIPSAEGCRFDEPHAIALDDRVVLHIREDASFTIWQTESFDWGKTWTEPRKLDIENGSPPHLLQLSNGVLISVYGRRKAPYGQRVMISKDKGQTWDVDYVLRDDGPSLDLGYPASVELKDGSILTVYYQQEDEEGPCVIMQSIWNLPEEYR